MPLLLSSPAFPPNGDIPWQYTCDGADVSPPLAWSGVPPGTKSIVLLLNDPDAPSGTFHHWAVYDISPTVKGLSAGYVAGRPARGLRQARNDFGQVGYGGPCPPKGTRSHHYHFRLLAIRRPSLKLGPSPKAAAVIKAAEPYTIETTELVGNYRR